MDLWRSRVINGILKLPDQNRSPEELAMRLAADVLIRVAPTRLHAMDLWPAIWALAASLTRQFRGSIYLHTGDAPLPPSPSPLGSRFVTTKALPACTVEIAIGLEPATGAPIRLWGDASGNTITVGTLCSESGPALPWSAFALAGYLSYAALASAVEIPPFRQHLCMRELVLPGPTGDISSEGLGPELHFLGMGHLGNAYLALLFFLTERLAIRPVVRLVDRDRLTEDNTSTHILVDPDAPSIGENKVLALGDRLTTWGYRVISDVLDLSWGRKPVPMAARLAFLGFDNLEARRIAASSGYEWLIDAGIGTAFQRPRMTWHAFAGDYDMAKQLFKEPNPANGADVPSNSRLRQSLESHNSGCGWVEFQGIAASAPAMGLIASAFVWCEALQAPNGERKAVQGSAILWSPLLPYWRKEITC